MRFRWLLFGAVFNCHHYFMVLGHHDKQLLGTLQPVLPGSCITTMNKCFLSLLFFLYLLFPSLTLMIFLLVLNSI